jgi:U3 small nucleolar RNA-associated protein 3
MPVDGENPFWLNGEESRESDDSEGSDDDVSPYGLKRGEQVSHASGGTPRLQNLEEEWQQDKLAEWMGTSASSKADKGKEKKKSDPSLGALEEGELEALMQDALDLDEVPEPSSSPKKKKKADAAERDNKETKKKKKKTAPPAPVFDLVEPEFASTKAKGKKGKQDSAGNADVDSEAFGDPTQLSHTDASDKAGRRKSLRFHTSKIER